ncbi:MAG: DUF4406 domain-containing protein [Bacteroidetes bacterium]|nr:DUF4406 domain-containing protein [Bacteroidota bacterium]
MKPIIYIAGKVSGEPEELCRLKFESVEKLLCKRGFHVINPLRVVGDFNTPWKTAMRLCIHHMMSADALLMLDDYSLSRGANIERDLAVRINIPVYYDVPSLYSMLTPKK